MTSQAQGSDTTGGPGPPTAQLLIEGNTRHWDELHMVDVSEAVMSALCELGHVVEVVVETDPTRLIRDVPTVVLRAKPELAGIYELIAAPLVFLYCEIELDGATSSLAESLHRHDRPVSILDFCRWPVSSGESAVPVEPVEILTQASMRRMQPDAAEPSVTAIMLGSLTPNQELARMHLESLGTPLSNAEQMTPLSRDQEMARGQVLVAWREVAEYPVTLLDVSYALANGRPVVVQGALAALESLNTPLVRYVEVSDLPGAVQESASLAGFDPMTAFVGADLGTPLRQALEGVVGRSPSGVGEGK